MGLSILGSNGERTVLKELQRLREQRRAMEKEKENKALISFVAGAIFALNWIYEQDMNGKPSTYVRQVFGYSYGGE